MNPDRFRSALAGLGWTQTGAARLLDVDARTVRRWCADDDAVPGPVWRLLDLLTVPENKARIMQSVETGASQA